MQINSAISNWPTTRTRNPSANWTYESTSHDQAVGLFPIAASLKMGKSSTYENCPSFNLRRHFACFIRVYFPRRRGRRGQRRSFGPWQLQWRPRWRQSLNPDYGSHRTNHHQLVIACSSSCHCRRWVSCAFHGVQSRLLHFKNGIGSCRSCVAWWRNMVVLFQKLITDLLPVGTGSMKVKGSVLEL